MKKIVPVFLLAVVAWIGFQSYQAGKFAILPQVASPEEKHLQDLEKQLRAARSRLAQSGRAASLSGVDTTAAAEADRREIERLEKEIVALRKRLGKAGND